MIGHDAGHRTAHVATVGNFSTYRCACGELFTGTPRTARQDWLDHTTKMVALAAGRGR